MFELAHWGDEIMERAEIHAAAERLRRVLIEPLEEVYRLPTDEAELRHIADLQGICDAYLAEHQTEDGEAKFYLQKDRGYLGNSPMLWSKDGCGYTQWLDEAKLFTEAEADQVIRGASSHRLRKWPKAVIDQHSQRSVDIQRLPLTERQP